VLVVDDEPQILKVAALLLEPHHQVTCEQRAHAALERIRRGERFDVILCDLMLPEMSGMDLYEALLDVAPEQANAMIFVTGGAFTDRARVFLERLPSAPIDKPFDPATLLARLEQEVQRTM
jgi:CheY-like chemotaxis protein